MIFGKNKNSKNSEGEAAPVQTKKAYSYRITEKAAKLGDVNVYVINILDNKNKIEIVRDLEKTYNVTVEGIRIVNFPKKTVFSRGRFGQRGGGRKAYVTLKKGDTLVLA